MRLLLAFVVLALLACVPPVQCKCTCGREDDSGHPLPPPNGSTVQTTTQAKGMR